MQEYFDNLTCINQTPFYSEEVWFRQVFLYFNCFVSITVLEFKCAMEKMAQ